MAHGLVELWRWQVEGRCEAPLHYGGRKRGVQGPRNGEFADRLPQCSMNASTSDCATASLTDSAFNNFLVS